jgi:hypothetical protein
MNNLHHEVHLTALEDRALKAIAEEHERVEIGAVELRRLILHIRQMRQEIRDLKSKSLQWGLAKELKR